MGAETTFGTTDADGAFEGRTVPGDTILQASADGFLPQTDTRSPWLPEVLIRARRGQTIEGVVARLRRVPTVDCWGQDGNWTPAGGSRHGPGTLRTTGRLRVSRGAFAVAARCWATCGGRVVATVRRAGTRPGGRPTSSSPRERSRPGPAPATCACD